MNNLSFCNCVGPAYGEPYCFCEMIRTGTPLNEEARAAERKQLEADLLKTFNVAE